MWLEKKKERYSMEKRTKEDVKSTPESFEPIFLKLVGRGLEVRTVWRVPTGGP